MKSHWKACMRQFGCVLAEIPEVMEACLVSGDYDYHIRIAVKDTRDYERLLRWKLYKIPGWLALRHCGGNRKWLGPG